MATIGPISVAANGDDGNIRYTSLWVFESAGESANGVGWFGEGDGSTYYYIFLRFVLSGAIPSGATIDSATLELYGLGNYQWVNGTDDLTVLATDSGNASAPTNAAARPAEVGGSTALATATVSWPNVTWNAAGWNTSPDIKTIIQELVNDNGGLASGAGIVLWARRSAIAGNVHQVAAALYEHATADPCKLTINYTAGGGTAVPVFMHHLNMLAGN